jgi:hypothetical protein
MSVREGILMVQVLFFLRATKEWTMGMSVIKILSHSRASTGNGRLSTANIELERLQNRDFRREMHEMA